jgi:hypothetical protein
MDPNACLKWIEDHIDEDRYHDARESSAELLTWLLKKGFAPDWSHHPRGTAYFIKYLVANIRIGA